MKFFRIIRNNYLFSCCIYPIRLIYRFCVYKLMPDKLFLKMRFKKVFNYSLNTNHPKTLNEKIQWLKLNDRTELHTQCADKLKVRDFIAKELGEKYLIPLILKTDNFRDLSKDKFSNISFIIKTNNGCGTNYIVRDKNVEDWEKIRSLFKEWLKQDVYSRGKEWQYKNIKPCILVEKLMLNSDNKIPNDYKFHCFNGKVKLIYVSVDREGSNCRNIYDENWNLLNLKWAAKEKINKIKSIRNLVKPSNLKKMIELAEKVSSRFNYVRVDFYNVDNRIYFGEITFHHGSGFDIISPFEWDCKLGEMLKLPTHE